MADNAELKSTVLLADSAVDDPELPPEDLREVLEEMCTEEALSRNTIKMVEGLLRDGFMDVGLEIGTKVQETNEVPRVVTDTAVMEHYINAAETGPRMLSECSSTCRGMQPNEETYKAVLDGIGHSENKAEAEEERREFVENVKAKGFLLVLQKEAEEMANPPPLKSEMDMLKEHVMKVFEDVIRDFEDKNEQKRLRQMAEDYDSLSSVAHTFYKGYEALFEDQVESVENAAEFRERVKPNGDLPDPGEGREGLFTGLMKAYQLYGDLQKKTTDKDMQEVIRKISDEGFEKHAAKMFCAMVEDGNVGEAMDLFQSTPETRINPLVIVHTTVIEAYIKFNLNKDALQTYLDMLAAGLAPNSYIYSVLIKGLAVDANFIADAKKYLIEMLDKGMHPNAATYTAVLEGFAQQEDKKADEEGKEFLEVMMAKGFVPDTEAVREVLKGRPAPVFDRVMSIILSKME
ncbi:hypothetical protein ACLB2K_049012 [Fragaria x ananassa]